MTLTLSETFYDGYLEYVLRRHQLALVESAQPVIEARLELCSVWLPDILTGGTLYQEGKRHHALLSDTLYVGATTVDKVSDVKIVGSDQAEIDFVLNALRQSCAAAPTRVRWVYKSDGTSVRLPLDTRTLPRDEFYPFITKPDTLQSYYSRYLGSHSNVLVLIGPPGTGKTSFIKGLVNHDGAGAIISYDDAILRDDQIFADFMSGDEKFLVLEDADTFLSSRQKSGNTIMHKFLNVGDGLMSTAEKKIVFSTNLPSVRDVDPALIRPGRCFDVIHFDKLSRDQCTRIRPEYTGPGEITLAELLGDRQAGHTAPRGVGFSHG